MGADRLPRRGEFDHQVLTGVFEPVLEDGSHRATYFGLSLEASWPYGVFRTASGKVYGLMRKCVQRTTRGLLIEVTGDGGLFLDPRCFQGASGGHVRRELTDTEDIYASEQFPGGPSFEFRLGRDEVSWRESGILDVRGPSAGPGFHVYSPWRIGDEQGGVYYTSLVYLADGTVFGEDVSGFVFFDQSYLPHGMDWNDSPVWTRLQGAWMVFANEYDDGSIEWGHLSYGADRFRFAVVANQTDVLVDTRDVNAKVEYKDNGFASRVLYELDGSDAWEFVNDPDGDMVDFSAARPGWRGHLGYVGRVGETRTRRRWGAWQEVFPDRV